MSPSFRDFGSSLGAGRIQNGVYNFWVLPCVENRVDVDTIVGKQVVYRERETLRKGSLEATVGFMEPA
ncbi:MAG: hypothetical protein ACKO0N_04365 [Planctomycetota bacterium]